jgi:hypothetical protein
MRAVVIIIALAIESMARPREATTNIAPMKIVVMDGITMLTIVHASNHFIKAGVSIVANWPLPKGRSSSFLMITIVMAVVTITNKLQKTMRPV